MKEYIRVSQGEGYSQFRLTLFASIVLASGIFGMSIANVIFLDEMTMDNNVVLEKKIDSLEVDLFIFIV